MRFTLHILIFTLRWNFIFVSDGVGRSGCVSTIMSVTERVKSEQTVDVFQTVKLIRAKRPGAVLTLVSYYLVHPREVDLRERLPGPHDNCMKSIISFVPHVIGTCYLRPNNSK